MFVDLLFPARGNSLPADHTYALYAALSRTVTAFHEPDTDLRFAPLSGIPGEPGRLQLTDRSHLRVRLPGDAIRLALPLAGKSIEVAGTLIRLGAPRVYQLRPSTVLEAPN